MIDYRNLRHGDKVLIRGTVRFPPVSGPTIQIGPNLFVDPIDVYIAKVEERPIGVGDKVIFKTTRDKKIRNLYIVKALDENEAWLLDIVTDTSHITKLVYLERLTETNG